MEENARTRRLVCKLNTLEGGEGWQGLGDELEAGRAKFDEAERHIKATLHTIDSLLGHAPKVSFSSISLGDAAPALQPQQAECERGGAVSLGSVR